MLSHSPSLYFPQWPTVAHICYYLHSFTIILGVQCPNSSVIDTGLKDCISVISQYNNSVIDTGLKVLSSWFTLQASNIQQEEGMTMRRMTEAIDKWKEGDQLMCMDEEVQICIHKNMVTKLAIQAEMKKEK